jgi:hypothetical protein
MPRHTVHLRDLDRFPNRIQRDFQLHHEQLRLCDQIPALTDIVRSKQMVRPGCNHYAVVPIGIHGNKGNACRLPAALLDAADIYARFLQTCKQLVRKTSSPSLLIIATEAPSFPAAMPGWPLFPRGS